MPLTKTVYNSHLLIVFFLAFIGTQYAGESQKEKKEEPSQIKNSKNYKEKRNNDILSTQHILMAQDILRIDSLSDTELKQIEIITKSCITNDLNEALGWSYYTTAKIYESIDQPEVALEYLKLSQSGKSRTNAPDINLFFAELYSQIGNPEKSNKILEPLVYPNSKNSILKTELLYIENLIASQKFIEAINSLERIRIRQLTKEEEIEIINKIAICYISTDQIEEGIQAYQEAILITENKSQKSSLNQRAKLKSSISNTLKSNKRYQEDVQLITASLKDEKVNPLEYLRLAKSYYALKDYKKAANSIKKYIQKPNFRLIDKSEITIIRNTARVIENEEDALMFIDFYTTLEDTIEYRRNQLKSINNVKGIENLLQLELLRKEKEISQNAINSLVKEDALKERILIGSRWAIGLLLVLIFIGLFAGIYILKVSKQRRIANQKLALRSLRSQMNPHFIFNALNSVNSFISENDQRSANKFLTSFSRLMRLVMENSEHDFISVQKELEILEIYLELEHFRFKDKFDYKIQTEESLEEDDFEIPPMLIQPYIENAIWHGLRYKENTGKLILKLEKKENNLLVTISDNGIGRKKSAELKTANQKKNRSTALRNIKERIYIVNELNNLTINVSIQDYNKDGTGTIVCLTVPQYGIKK